MATAKIKKDANTGEYYLDLDDILKDTELTSDQVAYYELSFDNDILKLILFDKNKKRLHISSRQDP